MTYRAWGRALRRLLSDPAGMLLGARGWANLCAEIERARRGALAAPFGKGMTACRVLGRYPMVVSNTDEGFGLNVTLHGIWEPSVTHYIEGRIRPGMACADIGANAGYFTVLMAALTGPQGSVVAVEPYPPNLDLLRRNVRMNSGGQVTILATAVGDASGEVTMVIPEGEPKNAMIQPDGLDYSGDRECSTVTVPVARLDDLPIARLDFIKIDIEGAEPAAWAGMQETLDRFPRAEIVLEVNPGRYRDPRSFIEAIAARYPLRAINAVGAARRITVEEVLAATDDVMLVLRNDAK